MKEGGSGDDALDVAPQCAPPVAATGEQAVLGTAPSALAAAAAAELAAAAAAAASAGGAGGGDGAIGGGATAPAAALFWFWRITSARLLAMCSASSWRARVPRPCSAQKAAARASGASPCRTRTSPVRPSPMSTVIRRSSASRPPCAAPVGAALAPSSSLAPSYVLAPAPCVVGGVRAASRPWPCAVVAATAAAAVPVGPAAASSSKSLALPSLRRGTEPPYGGGRRPSPGMGDEATSNRSCSCCNRASSERLRSIRWAIDWRRRSSASAMRASSLSRSTRPPATMMADCRSFSSAARARVCASYWGAALAVRSSSRGQHKKMVPVAARPKGCGTGVSCLVSCSYMYLR